MKYIFTFPIILAISLIFFLFAADHAKADVAAMPTVAGKLDTSTLSSNSASVFVLDVFLYYNVLGESHEVERTFPVSIGKDGRFNLPQISIPDFEGRRPYRLIIAYKILDANKSILARSVADVFMTTQAMKYYSLMMGSLRVDPTIKTYSYVAKIPGGEKFSDYINRVVSAKAQGLSVSSWEISHISSYDIDGQSFENDLISSNGERCYGFKISGGSCSGHAPRWKASDTIKFIGQVPFTVQVLARAPYQLTSTAQTAETSQILEIRAFEINLFNKKKACIGTINLNFPGEGDRLLVMSDLHARFNLKPLSFNLPRAQSADAWFTENCYIPPN